MSMNERQIGGSSFLKMKDARRIERQLNKTLKDHLRGKKVDFSSMLVKLSYFVPQVEAKLANNRTVKAKGRGVMKNWTAQWKPVLEELKSFGVLRSIPNETVLHEPTELPRINSRQRGRSIASLEMEVRKLMPTPQRLPKPAFDFETLPLPVTSR